MKTSQIGTHRAGIGQRGWVGAFESAHVTFAGSTLLTLVPVGEGITELHVDWSNNYDDPVEDSRDVVKGKRRAGSGGHGRAATSAAGEVVPPVLPELRALPAQRGRRRCNPESLLVR
ncbi:hypothetical protein GW17_00027077 [Ensete ventricosum]|nr:hypothetical protein GW17_00027077 [Ensete ventricosum]